MNYLEKLKINLPQELSLLPKVENSKKEPTSHTALTAKSTLGTLDSTRGSHFSGNKKQDSESFDLSEKPLQQQHDALWQKADELADWIDDPGSDIPWQERAAKVPELQEMSLREDNLKGRSRRVESIYTNLSLFGIQTSGWSAYWLFYCVRSSATKNWLSVIHSISSMDSGPER